MKKRTRYFEEKGNILLHMESSEETEPSKIEKEVLTLTRQEVRENTISEGFMCQENRREFHHGEMQIEFKNAALQNEKKGVSIHCSEM